MSLPERRKLSLSEARTDGWFEQIAQSTPGFGEVCRLLGERPLAYSIMLGLRIVSVQVDPSDPDQTVVEFQNAGAEDTQRAPLPTFFRALMTAMSAEEDYPAELSEDPSSEELQMYVGLKFVLLCGLLGVGLDELEVGGDKPADLHITVGELEEVVPLVELRRVLTDRLQREGLGMNPGSGQQIDLGVIPGVLEAAERADWDAVIESVGGWPPALTMFTRTFDFQKLDGEVKTKLARAMMSLAEAYCGVGHGDGAEEAFRLAGQIVQDLPYAAHVLQALGSVYVGEGREAEAIGILKRAIALGAPRHEVLPLLAKSFVARGRNVPGLVCMDEAIGCGVPRGEMAELRAQAIESLGGAWEVFRERVPAVESDTKTIAPPDVGS